MYAIEAFEIMNLKSRCLENNTYDLDVFKSILSDEEGNANLKYFVIFYPMAHFWTLTHKDGGIFSVRMKTKVLSLSQRLNSKYCKYLILKEVLYSFFFVGLSDLSQS